MKYVYEEMDIYTMKRKDTFTRWEELRNIDFLKSYVLIFSGFDVKNQIASITNQEELEAWVTARERDVWVEPALLKKSWEPFKEADIVLMNIKNEMQFSSAELRKVLFSLGYLVKYLETKDLPDGPTVTDKSINEWLNKL
jgi:hypothetical protein